MRDKLFRLEICTKKRIVHGKPFTPILKGPHCRIPGNTSLMAFDFYHKKALRTEDE